MISIDTKQEITRRYLREGDSERKIARDLQINRKTVKKCLWEHRKLGTIEYSGQSVL